MKPRAFPYRSRVDQSGLTLVESLVAIVLTLVLITAVSRMLFGTQQNTLNQSNRSFLDDNARFAVEYLSRAGQRAGFKLNRRSDNDLTFAARTVTVPVAVALGVGQVIWGNNNALIVRYEGHIDGQMFDCQNNAANQLGVYVETWWLNNGSLSCTLLRPNNIVSTEPLVSNVTAFNLQYGVDLDADGFPDEYQAANAIADWKNVKSVSVALQLAAVNDAIPVSTTIALRNDLR